MQAEFWLERWE